MEEDKNIVTVNTQNDDNLETKPEVDVEKLQETNRKLYERAKSAEAEAKRLRESKEPTKEADPELKTKVDQLYQIEEKRKFGYENQLSPEETDWLFKVSGGKPTKETFEDPFVKSGLEGYRQTKRVENNTPGSTNRSQSYTTDDGKFSEEKHRKAFEERSKQVLK